MTVTTTRPSTSETRGCGYSPWDTRRVKTLVDGT